MARTPAAAPDCSETAGLPGAAENKGLHEQDPLAVLFSRAEARAATPLAESLTDHVGVAVGAFIAVWSGCPDAEYTARVGLAGLIPRVLADAGDVRAHMRADPARPDLERMYGHVLSELSLLASVFVSTNASARVTPDPYDSFADEYQRIHTEIGSLIETSLPARPVWGLMRTSLAWQRRAPPRRRAPRTPLAD